MHTDGSEPETGLWRFFVSLSCSEGSLQSLPTLRSASRRVPTMAQRLLPRAKKQKNVRVFFSSMCFKHVHMSDRSLILRIVRACGGLTVISIMMFVGGLVWATHTGTKQCLGEDAACADQTQETCKRPCYWETQGGLGGWILAGLGVLVFLVRVCITHLEKCSPSDGKFDGYPSPFWRDNCKTLTEWYRF